ncbi:MAG: DUF1156 domain-containing protein [Candidatus Binatia bacterium]
MTASKKKLIEVALPLEAINKASAREKSIRHGHPSTLHLWWARRPLAAARAVIEIPPKFADNPPVNPEAREKYLGTRASRPHKQWHSRGYLPHFDQPGLVQSITFRLYDSLPHDVLEHWKQELGWREQMSADDPDPVAVELRERIARYEDEGHGHSWLTRDDIGGLVEESLLHFDGQRYRLLAWCVMPNHVHVVIETRKGYPLGDVVHSWKSFTAKKANKLLVREGDFWMADYYDRFIRDEDHLAAATAYNESNPVKAGLVERAEQWKFSSAAGRSRIAAKLAGETPALPGIERSWKGAQGLAEDVRYYGKWMRDEAEKRIGHLYPKVELTAEMAKGRTDLKPYVGKKLTVIAWLWARTVKSPNPAFSMVDVPLVSTFMLSSKVGKETYVEPIIESSGYRFTVKVGKPKNAGATTNGTKLSRGANFQCVMSGAPIVGDYIKGEGKAGRMGEPYITEGNGVAVYADAVATYLAFSVSKALDRNTTLCTWEHRMNRMGHTFTRQALPMTWDYVETNPIGGAGGDIYGTADSLCEVLDNLLSRIPGHSKQSDASSQSLSVDRVVSTDPPYYDNVPYADLSDFFYVWLRQSLKPVFPDLFATLAVPKSEELVAFAYRHGGKIGAEAFFLNGMTEAMHRIAEQAHPAHLLSHFGRVKALAFRRQL